MSNDKIVVKGARENNLKNIDLELPKNSLIVMTGVSGSGKSSLAFDTIYAEGQRRYIESLSAYARQFLGGGERANVDSIEGLSPSISIDQKTTNNNPRSTVGTVTEIYDYLRLLFARIGIPYCPIHKKPISSQSVEEMTNKILEYDEGTKLEVYAPIAHGEKGTHKDLFDKLRKDGYVRVRVNGEIYDLSEEIKLEKNKKDNIDVLIDRIVIQEDVRSRLFESIENATKLANGKVVINILGNKEIVMSENYACPLCDFSLPELEPRIFSFNAPYGACPSCKGLGKTKHIDLNLLIPDWNLSIPEGGIKSFKYGKSKKFFRDQAENDSVETTMLNTVAEKKGIDLNKKLKDFTEEELNTILYGSDDIYEYTFITGKGTERKSIGSYEGIVTTLERRYMETSSSWIREWIETFMGEDVCPTCKGARLQKDILNILVNNKSIWDVVNLSIKDLIVFFNNLKLTKQQQEISELIVKEIKNRLEFLDHVGLNYLSLSREAGTLSGGEAQRIRLATQIGSRLSGVLYVLDEPSIGLHQKDNDRLIESLKDMRDLGNTLIVVEHDEDTMRAADHIVDIGPEAGNEGGYLVAQGTIKDIESCKESITGAYLSGRMKIDVPKKRRKGNKKFITIKGASENNLKNINVKIPLGTFTCVTGVSGSGKSSLVNEILSNALHNSIYKTRVKIGKHKSIDGIENIDKVIQITQDPIGRTPRSNPATYTSVFDDIREVFAQTKEAKMRGYDKGRFSFNVKGGRCEACWGDGVKKIEMHFLPDVYVPCDVCHGTRFNRETLDIKFKGKNINDVLNMRVEEAIVFFENQVKVRNKLQVLMDVGLGYIKLGQSAPTLSGGEAGRIKLAKELQKKATGKSVFILDEPTTGLHTHDISKLINILQRIVDNGDTVVVIEHNLDVIKVADYIIDLGPEGGNLGGEVIAEGTPEEVSKCKNSYTGEYLKKYL